MTVTPHPAKGVTRIRITLPDGVLADAGSTLGLYDLEGNRVMDLSAGFARTAFTSVEFDANDLPAGLYHCRLVARRWNGVIGSFIVEK